MSADERLVETQDCWTALRILYESLSDWSANARLNQSNISFDSSEPFLAGEKTRSWLESLTRRPETRQGVERRTKCSQSPGGGDVRGVSQKRSGQALCRSGGAGQGGAGDGRDPGGGRGVLPDSPREHHLHRPEARRGLGPGRGGHRDSRYS